MAIDPHQLNTGDTRTGLNLALLYSVPVLLWAAGVANEGSTPVADIALQCAGILFLVQALSVALIAPWYATQNRLQDGLVGLLIVLLVPLPLLSIIWLTGAVEASVLASGQSLVLGLSALLLVFSRSLNAVIPAAFPRDIMIACVQVGAAAGTWAFRHQWMALAGL